MIWDFQENEIRNHFEFCIKTDKRKVINFWFSIFSYCRKISILTSQIYASAQNKSNNKIDFAFNWGNKVTKIHLSSRAKIASTFSLSYKFSQVSRKLRFCLPPAHKSNIKLNTNKFASLQAGSVSGVALWFSQNKIACLMALDARLQHCELVKKLSSILSSFRYSFEQVLVKNGKSSESYSKVASNCNKQKPRRHQIIWQHNF